MKDSRLIKILKTLSRTELNEYEKLLTASYFNKGRNLLPYFKILKKYFPEFDSNELTKESLFVSLHKEKTFDKKANELMNKIISDLQRILDSYLVYKQLENKPTRERILLAEAYLNRGLHNLGLELTKKSRAELIKSGIDEDFYLHLQKLISLEAEGYASTGKMKLYHNSYKEFSDSILLYILLFFLNDLPHRKNYNLGSNVKLELSVLSEALGKIDFPKIINNLSKQSEYHSKVLDVYYHLYLCYKDLGDLNLYLKFRDSVFANLEMFFHAEKYNLLNYLHTISDIAERFHGEDRKKLIFEIEQKMMEIRVFGFRKNEIHYTTFNNIVSNMLSLDKIDKAEDFISEYGEYLEKDLRFRYVNMALARVNFEKKNYRKTLELISAIPDLALNRVSISQLKILCLYELKEFESAINHTEALKKYLKENKTISKEITSQYHGFASGVRILINSQLDPSIEPIEKLTMLFKKYPLTFKKNWLMKKAQMLKN